MEAPPPTPLPQPPPHLLQARAVAVLATVLVFGLFIMAGLLVQPLNVAFGIWFTQIFVFLGTGWLVLRGTGRDPVHATGLTFPGLGPAAFGFVLGVVNFFALVVPIQYASQRALPESWQQIYDVTQLFQGQTPVELAFIVGGVGLVAPLCEEFFFRGIFLRGLRAPGSPPARAILASAVVFSAFHLDPVGFLARVELGALFGWLLIRTGSLWPGILAHAANNLVSTALYFTARQFESPAEASTREELTSILAFTLMGCAVLWALLAAARHFPGLLGARQEEGLERPVPLLPFPRLARLALPWATAATVSLAAIVALDARGIQLSQIDRRYPLLPLPKDAPDALHAEREALYQLRVRARRGELPLEAYAEERERQSRQHERP